MDLEKLKKIIKPYSMASTDDKVSELFDYLEHIRLNNVEGDFVECGVWKGGTILGIMEYLSFHNMRDRKVWGYDTFSGLTEPTENDYELNGWSHQRTKDYWLKHQNDWCKSGLEEVRNNLSSTTFPKENLKLIVGDICQTLLKQENVPLKISLLRLDTDWYESTKAEMDILYPFVSENGVVIVDDYNYWNGSREAVDETINYKEYPHINRGKIGTQLSWIKKKIVPL
jgi:hypothetical protein